MNKDTIIEVNQVSMKFNMASEKFDSFKEYFIKTLKNRFPTMNSGLFRTCRFLWKEESLWG